MDGRMRGGKKERDGDRRRVEGGEGWLRSRVEYAKEGGRQGGSLPSSFLIRYAACKGNRDAVQLLLSSMDADCEALDAHASSGFNPLSIAASSNHIAVCSLLLSFGAEMDHSGRDGRTALHHAVGAGHTEAAGLLIEARASPHKVDERGVAILDLAIKRKDEEMVSESRL